MRFILLLFFVSQFSFASAFFKGAAGGSGVTATTIPGGNVIETRYHEASVTNITSSAWVEVDTPANIPSGVRTVQITSTIGQPLEFGIDATACDSATVQRFVINRGDGPLLFGVTLTAGQKLCVKSLDASATSGELTINLMGP